MKVSSILMELRYQLADVRALSYPDELLLEWLNDGLCFIHQALPEAFARTQVVRAVAGSVQCVDDCCTELFSVDAVTDVCGSPLPIKTCSSEHLLRTGSVRMAEAFQKRNSKGARTVQLSPKVSQQFWVNPPVSDNEELYFRVTCSSPPEPVTALSDDLPDCKHHEALFHYVLYRAYLTEMDSPSSHALSNEAYQRVISLLGLERSTRKIIQQE